MSNDHGAAIEAAVDALAQREWHYPNTVISSDGKFHAELPAYDIARTVLDAAAPLIEADVRRKIAEEAAETFEEWRVTGQPALGWTGYDFTWSPERNPHLGDPERAARSFVAAIAKEGGWESGPHLTRRKVTRTAWEPIASGDSGGQA